MFKDVESIITEPLKFKAKLAIGEDAYTSLRLKNKIYQVWDTLGAAGTGVTIAKSSVVASTFFAPSGFLGALGIGAAATPLGWVIAAAIISGGAWFGVSRYIENQFSDKVIKIPEFINTPMDVLALGLFDLMMPLSLKIAFVDETIDPKEKTYIASYFVKEWGYNDKFVTDSMLLIENNLSNFTIKDIASSLVKFQKENPDCNYNEMSKEIILFLNNIMESDGIIDKREEKAIYDVEKIFKNAGKISIIKTIKTGIGNTIESIAGIFKNKTSSNNLDNKKQQAHPHRF